MIDQDVVLNLLPRQICCVQNWCWGVSGGNVLPFH